MNKLTCRGCGKELENCTCNVLTTSKERTTLKLIEIDDYCIICELQHGGECFDIECHIKSRHEGRLSGARQQMEADQLVVDNLQARIKDLEAINEAHQKLNRELRERIKELEELILTKEEAEDYYNWIKEITGCIVGFNDCVGCRLQAKLQKIRRLSPNSTDSFIKGGGLNAP